MEPELGLGLILKTDNRQVAVDFPGIETQRIYAIASAPLKRAHYHAGDTLYLNNKNSILVESVTESEGLYIYCHAGGETVESDLAGTQKGESPLPRLLNGNFDKFKTFDLRVETLNRRHAWLKSPARGFVGCRVSLIPHQLDVAFETASRPVPRIMLSDEVGLGKTIEAGLILHRLLLTERIRRVLIIVPEALTVQWFIELYRRFHLSFTLVGDHPLKEELGEMSDTDDPFAPSLCLASLEGLLTHPKWITGAVQAPWDVVLFDEAHHLDSRPEAYQLALVLAQRSPGLMLLTAIPESVGLLSHFNRLQLLDPARYADFDSYRLQQEGYQKLASLADRLLTKLPLSETDHQVLIGLGLNPENPDRQALVQALIDRHGEGRAVFRNTRHLISGFPERMIHPVPLTGDTAAREQIADEIHADTGHTAWTPVFDRDPRLDWLIHWLKAHPREKALLICHTASKAEALIQAIQKKRPVKTALFHENMSLLQRDRQAAWFAETDGARMLVASEIGGEGRNFQFAHHLIFFDYPVNPELVEQRIGRLDRIGQKETVHIHLPYIQDTGHEMLFRWLHDGLNAFQSHVPGAYILFQEQQRQITQLIKKPESKKIQSLTRKSRQRITELNEQIHQGRDRLLELNACRPERAGALVKALNKADHDPGFHHWIMALLDHFGIHIDAHTPENWALDFTLLNQPALPLPREHEEGVIATLNREVAQEREDWIFLSSEHPLVDAAVTWLLQSESGNASLAKLVDFSGEAMFLEMVFLLEPIAPPQWFIGRFLPPTPIRIVVSYDLTDEEHLFLWQGLNQRLRTVHGILIENPDHRMQLRKMEETGRDLAGIKAEKIKTIAVDSMSTVLDREIQRLHALARVNPSVKEDEIRAMMEERKHIESAIRDARLRMDCLRLLCSEETLAALA